MASHRNHMISLVLAFVGPPMAVFGHGEVSNTLGVSALVGFCDSVDFSAGAAFVEVESFRCPTCCNGPDKCGCYVVGRFDVRIGDCILASGGIKIGDTLHNSLRAKFKRLCCVLKRVDGFEYLTVGTTQLSTGTPSFIYPAARCMIICRLLGLPRIF